MAYVPNSGSVVAFQSDPTKLVGTFSVVGTVTATASGNQSISGAITAPGGSVMTVATLAGSVVAVSGTVSATITGNPSISGTVNVGNFPVVSGSVAAWLQSTDASIITVGTAAANQSVSGAVTAPPGSIASTIHPAGSVTAVSATQVTSPWIVAPNNSSLFSLQPAGSILAVDATFTPPDNQSVSGTVTALQGTTPWLTNQGGSVITVLQSSSVIARVTGSVVTLGVAGSITAVSATAPAGSIMAVSAVQPAGSLLTAIQLAGSIMAVSATLTPPDNQSVSGTVDVGNFPTSQNVSGSVVAFQGTAQWTVKSSLTGGIFPVSGSVAAVIVGTPNVNAAGSVVAFQGTTPWAATNVGSIITVAQDSSVIAYQLAGSILATSATLVPGSVSGAVTAPPGSIMAVSAIQPAGSILSATATQPAGSLLSAIQVAGSIMATRSTQAPGSIMAVSAVQPAGSLLTAIQLAGSVMAVSATLTPPENQSVSGTVEITGGPASVVTKFDGADGGGFNPGTTPIARVGALVDNPAALGTGVTAALRMGRYRGLHTIIVDNNASIQGTTAFPFGVDVVSGSVVTYQLAGSIIAVSGKVTGVAGSIMSTTSPAGSIIAVSGATTTTAGSIISATFPAGSITAVSGATTTTAGSIISATFPAGSVTAVSGISFSLSSVVVVAGSIITVPTGSVITIFQSSSIIARVTGSVATLGVAGSIMSVTNPAGSITAVSGTVVAGSIATVVNPAGSVSAVIWQAPSIVGTYSSDAAHGLTDKGIFMMGVRNDLMASVVSSDIDYSRITVGPVGETIVANSPITKWVQGTASMLGGLPTTGVAVPIIATGGTSVFTYITGLQITNPSANNAFIKLIDSGGAILGFTIAPATGGSNIHFANALKTAANTGFSASVNTVASVYLSAQGFRAKE